jgi:hypothetical protein
VCCKRKFPIQNGIELKLLEKYETDTLARTDEEESDTAFALVMVFIQDKQERPPEKQLEILMTSSFSAHFN